MEQYRAQCASKSDLERTDLSKEKTGVFTGAYAVNPANGAQVPVWIAYYVLMGYGTGAIMAVPAHDEMCIRDSSSPAPANLPLPRATPVNSLLPSTFPYTGTTAVKR